MDDCGQADGRANAARRARNVNWVFTMHLYKLDPVHADHQLHSCSELWALYVTSQKSARYFELYKIVGESQ